jgi:ATP-dependent Clp protease ATP-binding subunit ClpC
MTGFLGPGDPGSFDDFLARFLGPGARGPARRIDLTRLMSAGARELVATAVQLAIDRGDPSPPTPHIRHREFVCRSLPPGNRPTTAHSIE